MEMSSNKKKYSGSKTQKKKYVNAGILEATLKLLIKKGRKKVTTQKELLEFPKGSQISFVTKDNIYRAGGFLKSVKKTYFKYYPSLDKKFTLPVQFQEIKKIYVGSPLYLSGKKTSSNFPVKLGDKVLYYANDNFDKKRFMATKKYKDMKKWFIKYNN